VLQRALANGDDIVWPRIDSPDKIVADMGSLRKAGYKVSVAFIGISPADAITAARQRFAKTGRYVSPKVIAGYGDSPREAYRAALATGMVASHQVYHRSLASGLTKVEDAVTGDDEFAKRYRARLDESEARDTEALASFVGRGLFDYPKSRSWR
jgi:Zeta toxin